MQSYDPMAQASFSEPPSDFIAPGTDKEPKSISELLRRSAIMLENIQEEFLNPDKKGIDPRAARAALTAAGPLLKLLADKAPQLSADRHAIVEDCLVSALQTADDEFKTSFFTTFKEQLQLRSVSLKDPQ